MTCPRRLLQITALLLVASHSFSATAQNSQNRRQTVGLALSGGGALGLAHIGVLRYLEDYRIPLDAIAGTSMGGILGGLYAAGHDSASLESIVKRSDWDDLLRSTSRYEDRSIAEKQDWNRITGMYSIPLRAGFELPSGINSGQPLVRLLSSETAAYWDVRDFDELPIPFRCVAVDLVTGEQYVLRDGHLVEALRATMAIPGIFTPVEWEDRILADGGLVNNFPTDVAKQMGVDVVVGVTLRLPALVAGSLDTLPSIVRQTMNIAVLQNEMRNVPLADIEIRVQLSQQGLMDFRDTQALIQAGYDAARQNQAELQKLALSPADWEAHLKTRKSKERRIPQSGPLFDVVSKNAVIQRNAQSELSRKVGPETTLRELDATLSGLTAATGLPNSYYGWHSDGTRSGYQVKLEPRRSAEIVLRPSFFYHYSDGEPGRPNLKLTGTAVFRNSYKSRLVAALKLGSDSSITGEYYHPFGGTAYSIAPGVSLERAHFSQYVEENRLDAARDRFSGTLYFGIGTWRHVQLRVGGRVGLDRYSASVTVNDIETSDTKFANPEITGIINTQDSGVFPSRGTRVNASSGFSFRENSYPYLQLNFDHFRPVSENFTAFALGRGDSSMGYKLSFYDQFTAGGLNDMDAYRYQEIRGDTVVTLGGGVLYRGLNPSESAFRPYFGAWYQAASIDWPRDNSEFRNSASAGLFTPTPLGLAGLTLSFDMQGAMRFRFSLGSFWNRS